MSDAADLGAFWQEAWTLLREGVEEASSPMRLVNFATVSEEGFPQARTLALRKADPQAGHVKVHTDIETQKVYALQQNPFAALTFWHDMRQMQIRMQTKVEVLTGAGVEEAWQNVPPASRVSYGTNPRPGTAIKSAFAYEKPAVRERFAVLSCEVTKVDLVDLKGPHRRAFFQRSDGWRGTWVAP